MSDAVVADPAVSLFFQISIAGRDLGSFTSCEGLAFEVVVEQWEEGGNNEFVHQLPTRVRYSNLVLTRPVDGNSAKVAEWFASMRGQVSPTTATIVALGPASRPVASWTLEGVFPVRWKGPSLDVDRTAVATETLELAHHGFSTAGG